jgi:hypothetical protein
MKSLRYRNMADACVIANLVDPCVNDETRCYRSAIRDPRRVQGSHGSAYTTLSFLGASSHLPFTSL